MADFVAVIRRAVDGLTTNTPDTRAKVYEKARGAVQRQLENMKPRPPEEMLRRQMDKLELAITEVEAEHAEAAPVDDGFPYPGEEVAAAPVAAAATYAADPEPAESPVYRDEPEQDHAEAPAQAYEPAEEVEERYEPVHEPVHAAAEPQHATPAWDQVDEPVAYETRDEQIEEEAPAAVPAYEEPVEPEPHHDERTALAERAFFEEAAGARVEEDRFQAHAEPSFTQHAESREEDTAYVAPEAYQAPDEPVHEPAYEEPARYEPEQARAHEEPPYGFSGELSGHADRDWRAGDSAAEAASAFEQHDGWSQDEHARKQAELDSAWNDVPELIPAGPVEPIGRHASAERVDAHFDQETHVAADAVRMPPVGELSAVQGSHKADDAESFFADYVPSDLSQVDDGKAGAAKADDAKQADRDPWSDLEDLIGYTKEQQQQPRSEARAASRNDDDLEDLMPSPAKPYRVTPVRKRSYAGLVLGIVGLLVVAGGAYAVWINRDSLDELVGGLISSNSSGTSTAQQTPAASTANNGTPPAANPASSAATTTATPPAANQQAANRPQTPATTPAPADGSAANPKFTQRLMADGSETDDGPGAAGTLAQNAEGQSVAQLNSPPATPAPAAPGTAAPTAPAAGTTPPAANAPATPAPATPSGNIANTPAASGEKMFLYEERLGQTAPTAIDGTVSWSLLREPGANGGPPEPEVQGRITVPGRGLTALMTLKRNTDPSLPASHLIEIVFAVPPGFEGGAIDSVQRIAMKTTEQDRGNALIAVPAKITDDFHMIALNDFPDARNTNLDLLRTRNWIDIPVAYRNGRRALLTLQKGPEGEKAFNEAIAEWAKMPASPGSQ
ncbi:hypothetical protein [Neorhizobium alkalisoli]|uniref:Uncharacterized protein n=1 Tax=Neorhizobium alkalisoli TaxID=528178 RepID=A0A561QX10_9HYPH|nr:hypothetical protein [Neorhizobium alkalisoli]TWF54917.1 hypothetical protein FHW37_103788 [Neorhizobium alkalisoli]